MPGMTALEINVARAMSVPLIELKVDGTRITFDGNNIVSDRGVNRNERYPHILNELKQMGIVCRGEIALEGGNILQLNRKENWHKARYYIYDLYKVNGESTEGLSIVEKRNLIDEIVWKKSSEHITAPLTFQSFDDGWSYVTANMREGLVLKEEDGICWKVKRLTEEKLPIVSHVKGKAKGAFILNRNGMPCKVSGTSQKFVDAFHILKKKGLQAYAEIEYSFLTDDGIPYQPRLRRLGTLEMLKTT